MACQIRIDQFLIQKLTIIIVISTLTKIETDAKNITGPELKNPQFLPNLHETW